MGFTSKLPDTQLLLSPYSILLFIYSYEHSSAQRPQMSNISLGKEKKTTAKMWPERDLAQQAGHLHVAVPYIRDGR